jgi:hypothetical protein
MLDLMARMPRDAKAWMASTGFEKAKIKSMIAWIVTRTDYLVITVAAEGLEPHVAQPWVEGFATGARSTLEAKGIKVDDSWFKRESTSTGAKLVVTFPSEIFRN